LTVEEAGAALLAVEGRLNKVLSAAVSKYSASAGCAWGGELAECNGTEMTAGKEYWAVVAAGLGTYIEGLRAIRFPDVAAADAAVYVNATVTLRDHAVSASKATTLDTFEASADAAADARDRNVPLVQQLYDALGLRVGL
jgi:hypothetical protein